MPVLVSVRGTERIHPDASHYIITPTNICHIYTGDLNTASYRDWDYAYLGTGDDTGHSYNINADIPNHGQAAQAKQAAVPRTGFGS